MTDRVGLLAIGELASRTGLPVRTIRFYSDRGVLPPAGRTDGGYRLYGADALARLALVRSLRELGIDLATVRRVLEREVTVAEVAAAHAAALEGPDPHPSRADGRAASGGAARQRPIGDAAHAPADPTIR